MPESLKSINACAFRNNEHLQKVQLSESMESIGDYAFCNNAGLKEISFPKKLQSIGISAFENNPALESVTFNTEVENMSIGKNAFNGCAYIESVEIPSILEYIKDNIFKNCSNLKDVYCYATEVPPFAGSQDPSEMDDVFKAATLHVIYGNEAAYKRDSWWGRFSQLVGCNTPIPDPVKVESITLIQTEATLITAKSTDGSSLSTNCVVTVIPVTGIGNITMGDVKLVIKNRNVW